MFTGKGNYAPFKGRVCLSSPTMHGDEMRYMAEAYESNWMSTVGENIREVERIAAAQAGVQYAVALSSCTAALHLCARLAGERLYGKPEVGHGALEGRRVFCSDMTFVATVNPVVYEGAVPVFIDTEAASWNMDPAALERAFELYPDVKLVVCAELYGFSGNIRRIREICAGHGALLLEDAAEAVGAAYEGRPCGSFGDLAAISYNGNKMITGSAGGCLLTNDAELAGQARKRATQAREHAPWYLHRESGYNYRMSNVIAGIIRGQYPHLGEHLERKKAIYKRYEQGLRGLPVRMNPIVAGCSPNYWLSALTIDANAMCQQVRSETEASYLPAHGKSCPTEILEAIGGINAEGRPIWRPMSCQPMFHANALIGRNGSLKAQETPRMGDGGTSVGWDIFERGLCLPSDIKMTPAQQDRIMEVIWACFA